MKLANKTNSNAVIGGKGENAASDYLIHKGYRIIHRNFHIGKIGEIDIIASKKESLIFFWKKTLVFIEVKAGSINPDFNPVYHVDKNKRKKLLKLAEIYMKMNNIGADTKVRIDIITVKNNKYGEIVLDHYENAVFNE